MIFRSLSLACVLGLSSLSASALADDANWKLESSSAVSKKATLKIVSPKGMKIQFKEAGVSKEDTVPHVIAVPDEDSFVPVTFVDTKSGESFTDKIEIKKGQTTEVKAVFTPKPPVVLLKGKIEYAGAQCDPAFSMRMDFAGEASGTKKSFTLPVRKFMMIDLPADTYNVAFFAVPAKGEASPAFVKPSKLKIAEKGFSLTYSCADNTVSPALTPRANFKAK